MGRPVTPESGVLSTHKIDMSHQEMTRLLDKIEELWEGYTTDQDGPNGCEWLPVSQIEALLIEELGYEDQPEFEDALRGSFEDFLDRLPHVTKRTQNERLYFQLRADPPRAQWRDVKMTVAITSTQDLWRVCLKSKWARIEIPELEFEISADGKRHVDSIYNHIASAVYNLGNYVQMPNSGLSADHKDKIMDTVIALNILLDVPKPYTWVVYDPSGTSEFSPMDGVEVEWGPEPAAEGGAAAAAAGTPAAAAGAGAAAAAAAAGAGAAAAGADTPAAGGDAAAAPAAAAAAAAAGEQQQAEQQQPAPAQQP